MLTEAGFEIVSLVPTFGGLVKRLCEMFSKVVQYRLLTALTYPLLLAVSAPFKIEAIDGDYRFFVARKPK